MKAALSRAALALAALAAAPLASAHEVLHTVERDRAVALRAYFADGEVLAYAAYEIYAPADPKIPHQKGRTDRNGWLAFVPDAPGKWRVKVIEDAGHGLDVEVDAGPGASATPSGASAPSSAAFVLRPLVALAVLGAVFGGLFALYRRRGKAR